MIRYLSYLLIYIPIGVYIYIIVYDLYMIQGGIYINCGLGYPRINGYIDTLQFYEIIYIY